MGDDGRNAEADRLANPLAWRLGAVAEGGITGNSWCVRKRPHRLKRSLTLPGGVYNGTQASEKLCGVTPHLK